MGLSDRRPAANPYSGLARTKMFSRIFCPLLAAHRDPESYVAGSTPLNVEASAVAAPWPSSRSSAPT
jgi:hypothetical protein